MLTESPRACGCVLLRCARVCAARLRGCQRWATWAMVIEGPRGGVSVVLLMLAMALLLLWVRVSPRGRVHALLLMRVRVGLRLWGREVPVHAGYRCSLCAYAVWPAAPGVRAARARVPRRWTQRAHGRKRWWKVQPRAARAVFATHALETRHWTQRARQ